MPAALHVPGVTGGGEVFLKLIPRVTPLNVGKLKVLEGMNGTNPMGLSGVVYFDQRFGANLQKPIFC